MSTRFSVAVGRLAACALLSLATLGVAFADDADPPGRVARLSYAQGSVSIQPAGVQDWAAAVVNRPLTTGDKLWTDQGSRAELDIGAAVIRLSDTTGFSFLSLDDNTAQMQVTAGTLVVHVRELLDNQTYEIDTPNLAVMLESPGDYRVDVNDAGDTTIVRVSDGQAEASGSGASTSIHSQQMVTFVGTGQLSVSAATLGAPDGLDDWSMERDRRSDQAQSRQYVPDDMAGTQDLDDNGQWENTPDYGYVWTPTVVAAGWAPYSFGHWAWVGPWGWTWVDDAPWGFAPFHYGRWARWHNSWCWVPGPRYVRPVYAPAMVAWVGVSVGVGGGVGWFPLGPREVYVPGYHVSDRYVRNVNITNTTIVNNTYITNVYQGHVNNIRYANSGIPGAVTTVPRNVFTSAQPVGGHRMHLPPEQAGRFSPTGAPPAIAPDRQSVLGASAGHSVRRPPPALLNRQVVARTAPPPAPVSFDRQQAAIRANGGRPLARDEMVRLQPTTPSAQVRLVNPSQPMGRRPGFNRPGPEAEQGGRGADFARPGQQPGRGAGFDHPGAGTGQGGREPGGDRPEGPGQQAGHWRGADRPGQPGQARPGFSPPPASSDSRGLTEREHSLENSNLPRSQAPRNDRPPPEREGGGNPAQNGFAPNGMPRGDDRSQTFHTAPPPAQQERSPGVDRSTERSDSVFSNSRPPAAMQPNRVEQPRPPVNTYSRPPVESRQIEERRFTPPPVAPPPPAPARPMAPPPVAAPPHVTAPPPAPVPHAAAPPPQSAPPANREDRNAPHTRQGRPEPPR